MAESTYQELVAALKKYLFEQEGLKPTDIILEGYKGVADHKAPMCIVVRDKQSHRYVMCWYTDGEGHILCDDIGKFQIWSEA